MCSLFRSSNETMNIWTHLLGTLLFIFLIYLTYAIPVENLFTLRSDVAKANAIAQCSSKNLTDIVAESYVVNATCVEVASRDESIAEEFSALFYLIIFVITGHGRFDLKMIQQPDAVAGILCRDEIHFL